MDGTEIRIEGLENIAKSSPLFDLVWKNKSLYHSLSMQQFYSNQC